MNIKIDKAINSIDRYLMITSLTGDFNKKIKNSLQKANQEIALKTKKETELKTIHALQKQFLPQIHETLPKYPDYKFNIFYKTTD